MKKWTKVVSLVMGATLIANVAGCNLVTVDEDKDLKQVVATVNGVELLKEDYFVEYDYMVQMYQMYGMTADDSVKQTALDALVQSEVRKQKAEADGYSEFTDEELAQIDTEYEEILENFREGFREEVETELGADAKEEDITAALDKRVEESLAEQQVDLEEFKESLKLNKVFTKQQEAFNETVTVSDEELQKWYDEELATQKAGIEEDPANFETYSPQLIVPEGYFYVKHILLAADDDTKTKLTELQSEREPLAAELGNITVSDSDATISAETRASNETRRQEIMKQIEDIDKQTETLRAPLNQKAQELLTKIRAGEDFDALLAEHGEDTGMESSPDGYLISAKSTAFEQAFTDAAAKLTKIGDVSEPTWTGYGVHIIKRVADMPAGTKTLDEIKDEAHALVLQTKQYEEWSNTIQAWTEEAEVETFPDRLDDDRESYNQDQEQ